MPSLFPVWCRHRYIPYVLPMACEVSKRQRREQQQQQHQPPEDFMIKRQATVLADASGKVFDELLYSPNSFHPAELAMPRSSWRQAIITPRQGQDVVVDPAGVAYSVRLHLAQHLHVNQRIEKLEATVDGEPVPGTLH